MGPAPAEKNKIRFVLFVRLPQDNQEIAAPGAAGRDHNPSPRLVKSPLMGPIGGWVAAGGSFAAAGRLAGWRVAGVAFIHRHALGVVSKPDARAWRTPSLLII